MAKGKRQMKEHLREIKMTPAQKTFGNQDTYL